MSARRAPIVGRYTREELALAARNRGMPLEALRYDLTPQGLHYLLVHFDIPHLDPGVWRLRLQGASTLSLTLPEIEALPAKTLRVTLECAGNGRGQMTPRYPSVPWLEEGVSTAEWTGTSLSRLLSRAGVPSTAREIVFRGADCGLEGGIEHDFARSLPLEEALHEDVIVAYAMNGAPLPLQHGAPLRLIVPRWYGMASVKWLCAIEAVERPFDGLQQARSYHFRSSADERGVPCTLMRVNSLMVPPGVPDFYSRARIVKEGTVEIRGRAWSGYAGVVKVQLAIDGAWRDAVLDAPSGAYAWHAWRAEWRAEPGEHELVCRASDAAGNVQPLEAPWDLSGFGNNSVHRLHALVT